jgi:hypothetical protein
MSVEVIAHHREETAAEAAAAAAERHIVAERFKTKMCRNWVSTGECPYETRCMFAHGPDELRTKEMNLRDGLTNEEAIRNFKKMLAVKAHYKTRNQQPSASNAFATHKTAPQPAVHYQEHWQSPQQHCDCAECHSEEQVWAYNPYNWYSSITTYCNCPECNAVRYGCNCPDCLAEVAQTAGPYSSYAKDSSLTIVAP